ncbi:uncharacterized protein LOC131859722 [Cryptomeria japonica]|uniref:uncharacterized protein LOC131859722 n=1 Tax=Cryptomeria japonica TaxID=3369 RepID=UPI0027DA761D|nr:uncharacterized protein LOC131859722 [Cryptomeria japonica]
MALEELCTSVIYRECSLFECFWSSINVFLRFLVLSLVTILFCFFFGFLNFFGEGFVRRARWIVCVICSVFFVFWFYCEEEAEQRKDRGRGRAKEATSKRKISSSRMKVMAKGGSRACNFLRIG